MLKIPSGRAVIGLAYGAHESTPKYSGFYVYVKIGPEVNGPLIFAQETPDASELAGVDEDIVDEYWFQARQQAIAACKEAALAVGEDGSELNTDWFGTHADRARQLTQGYTWDFKSWAHTAQLFERSPTHLAKPEDYFPAFFRQYIETALWAAPDETLTQYGMTDIDPDCLAKQREQCRNFWDKMKDKILNNTCRGHKDPTELAESAGHDFLLTRNGSGAGFLDGDWAKYEKSLDKAASAAKAVYVSCEDGKPPIYIEG
jgi:hypothetical protein